MRKFCGSVGTRNFVLAKVSFFKVNCLTEILYEQKEARKFSAMARAVILILLFVGQNSILRHFNFAVS